MIKQDFDDGLAEFKAISSRAIPKDQKDAWWCRAENREGAQFIEACRALAETEERIPSWSKIIAEMNKSSGHEKVDCPHCDGIGLIPFFRVYNIRDRQSGSIVSARCSCPAGDRLWDGLVRFGDLFPLDVHRTLIECQRAALEAGTRWLHEKHWPQLYGEVPEGAQKRGLGKVLGKAAVEGG